MVCALHPVFSEGKSMDFKFFIYLIVMAGATYLIRMLPLVFFHKKIKSRFIRSFLYYIPYTVLASMTFPAVFYATSSVLSAAVGVCVAVVLAYFRRSLITVALGASVGVLAVELLQILI